MTRLHRARALLLLSALATGLAPSGAQAVIAPHSQRHVGAIAAVTAVPQAPFIESVAPSGLGALLTWAPNPAVDQVTSYAANATSDSTPVPAGCDAPPPSTALGTDSAMIAGGLCAGVAYTITLTATNSAGTGPASAASNPVVPLAAQPPSTPLFTSVLGRETALLVSWAAPIDDGGSVITGYTLTATLGTKTVTVPASASSTQASITGLIDGKKYKLGLQATNAIGTSAAATTLGIPSPPYPPGPPLHFSAKPDGSGGVFAGWAAPMDDGGDAITGYNVTYQQVVPNSTGTGWVPASGSTPTMVTVAATATSLTVSAFNPSAAYYSFSIAATSAAGAGQTAAIAAPVTPTTQLNSNAVVLDQATMDALGSDVPGTLTWPAPAPAQVSSLQVGQAIVGPTSAAAPNGVLAKIMSITQPTTGTYVVGTAQAALSDVLVDGSYAQDLNPLASGATFHAAAPGVRTIHRPDAVGFSTTVTLGIDLEADLGSNLKVHVVGEVDLTPTVTVDLTLQQNFLGIPDGGTITASGTVDAAASATFQLEVSGKLPWKTEIGEIHGEPVVFFIGPVPVVMLPKVAIFLQLGGQIDIGVSASVTVGAQMVWSTSTPGTLQTKNLTTPLQLTAGRVPGLALSATATIGLVAQVETQLYDAAGPDVSATLQLQATMDFNPPPSTPFLSVKPSVQLAVGLNVDVLAIKGQVSVTLATLPFPSFVIKAAPAVTMSVTPNNAFVGPAQQLTLSATRSDGFVFPLTWSLQGAVQADSISSGGVLTPAPPGGRSLTVVATDSTGIAGIATVHVAVAPFDSPQNLKVSVDNPTGSATLSWAAPLNTGGAPLASYTVTTQPSTTTQTLGPTATGNTVTGLSQGTTYAFFVFATNGTGLRSAPATAVAQDLASIWKMAPSSNSGTNRNSLSGVSCVSANSCTAVGYYTDSIEVDHTLIEKWNGRTWSVVTSPSAGSSDLLGGVSCVSASFCMAAGDYNNGTVNQTLIEAWNGSSWSIVASPNAGSNRNYLYGVSCVSATTCTAVGSYVNGSVYQTLIETWDGSTWSIVASPDGSTKDNYLSGVSCVAPKSCTSVGFYSTGVRDQTLVERWNGTHWSIVPSPNSGTNSTGLNDVSCTSPSACTAVGAILNVNGSDQTLVEAWNGTTWSIVPSPNASSNINWLNGVSCVAANTCTGVGYFVTPDQVSHTLIEAWNGSTWSIVPSPSEVTSSYLQGAACVSASSCTVVGYWLYLSPTYGNIPVTLVERS